MFNIISKIRNIFTKESAQPTPAPVVHNQPKPARVVPTAPLKPAPTDTKPSKGKYLESVKLSPQTNGQYAQKIKPAAIVLHDTGGNYLGSIDWTSKVVNPDTGKRLYASYHCIVARDGRRTITNHDDNRAYHAGASSFKGKSGLNQWSIGVAFERDSHSEPLQEAAMESALEYIIPRMKKWGITPDMVTDHRTVSPGRKVDLKKEEFEKFHALLRKKYNG
jgi:N-acetyl-anhydromuramyl-L-alanine amidase AmpD